MLYKTYHQRLPNLDIEDIYNITWRIMDYVKPTTDGELIQRNIFSFDTNFDEEVQTRRNKFYEVSSRKCVKVLKYVHWSRMEMHDLLRFYGKRIVDEFMKQVEEIILEILRIQEMDALI